jgi:uncharacterized membrane protein
MKSKNPKDIKVGDKVLLVETGFEYVVTYTTDASILINKSDLKYWIPKSLILIFDSLLSTSGYRLWKFKSLPEWFVRENKIQ